MLFREVNVMRVLLAEDEPDLNRIITKKLTSEGYSVDSCTDGEGAIDLSLIHIYSGNLDENTGI